MKKLILAVFILLSGCSTFTLTMPDGTTLSHTRFFDDQQIEDIKFKTKDFEGVMGKFRNSGQVDVQALIKILEAMSTGAAQ